MCAVLIFRLKHEEEFLAARLPGYADYCRQTRSRLIPGIY
jgi:protein-S-isoprenylcysteine O-methyltransferase Ste14